MEEEIMLLITYGGEARSKALMALKKIRENDFEAAEALLKGSSENILIAHKVQTKLLQKEASGEKEMVQLLMVHAQDHLMDAMVVRDIVEQMIEIQKINYRLLAQKQN